MDAEDARADEHALIHDLRIVSSDTLPGDRKLRVVTEADRSSTTVPTPDEY